MLNKKILFLLGLIFLLTSCADTWESVKHGVTGSKKKSTDEFLVQKKDPLIMPPDFENLPTPDERALEKKEISSFEDTLKDKSLTEIDTPSTNSSEMSILQKIRNK